MELLQTRYASIKPWPGTMDLLKALAERGVPLAIATSTPRDSYTAKMEHQRDIVPLMSAVVTGDEVPNGKPAPDIFIKAAQRLGVDPRRCLVFEDSPLGIQGAKAAGCFTVALPDARMASNASRFDALRPTFVCAAIADFDHAKCIEFTKKSPFDWLKEPPSQFCAEPTPGST